MKGSALLTTNAVAAALMLAALFPGCSKNDSNPETPNGPSLAAPTNLQAYSASQSSVGLQWTLSASESDAAFDHYALTVKDNTGVQVTSQSVPKGTSQTVVTSLTEGVVYAFIIRSAGSAGYLSSDSASVQWSPARRLTTDSLNGPPIQVYEFASTAGASGLQFYSPSSGGARTQSLRSSNPDRILSDVFLQTNTTDGSISLNNIALLSLAGGKNTFLATVTSDASGLDNPQSAPPNSTTYSSNTYTVPSTAVTASRILYARSTTDNKYVRILLMMNTQTSTLFYGTSPNRYVKVQISYQDSAGVIYSRFGSH